MVFLHFLHKAWLIFNYEAEGRWRTCAGMRSGDIREIDRPPTLWGVDRWILYGGEAVRSREIAKMLDRGDFGY